MNDNNRTKCFVVRWEVCAMRTTRVRAAKIRCTSEKLPRLFPHIRTTRVRDNRAGLPYRCTDDVARTGCRVGFTTITTWDSLLVKENAMGNERSSAYVCRCDLRRCDHACEDEHHEDPARRNRATVAIPLLLQHLAPNPKE